MADDHNRLLFNIHQLGWNRSNFPVMKKNTMVAINRILACIFIDPVHFFINKRNWQEDYTLVVGLLIIVFLCFGSLIGIIFFY